ncbi:MAG: hypothetical protein HOP10_09970 [Chitinophagaceae bacterium]|nr:hypothetical protein [Chitinophagaceae bacterium]
MTHSRKLLSCLLFLIVAAGISSAQEQKMAIRVSQDDAVTLTEFESTIKLKKKSFKFQVMLKNVEGVYVFASIRDSVYRFTENGPIQDFIYLPLLKLKDDEFNRLKELNISETGWSYWYYTPTAETHSFARKVTNIDTNTYICSKIIKEFYDVADNFNIKIRDIDKPLYVFFIAVADYDDTGRPLKELIRRKVKIEWTDDE